MPFGEPTPHRTGSQRQHNWTFPSLFCNFSHSFTTDHSIRLSEARDEPNLRFTPLHFPQFVPGEDAVPSHPQRSEHGGGTGEWRRSRGGEIDQRERRIWWFVQLVQRDSSNGAVAVFTSTSPWSSSPCFSFLSPNRSCSFSTSLELFISRFNLIEFRRFAWQGFRFSLCLYGASYQPKK